MDNRIGYDRNPFLDRQNYSPTYQKYDSEWPYEWAKPRRVDKCGGST
jgi:hypothetical protein